MCRRTHTQSQTEHKCHQHRPLRLPSVRGGREGREGREGGEGGRERGERGRGGGERERGGGREGGKGGLKHTPIILQVRTLTSTPSPHTLSPRSSHTPSSPTHPHTLTPLTPHTSISSLCMRTSLETLTFFLVRVLVMESPFLNPPWYTRMYVSWPKRPACVCVCVCVCVCEGMRRI